MPVFCTYCGQQFSRDEHLERHILTHTNIKPFKCYDCHMSFARRDLLQRHYTVHGRDANNQETLPPNAGIIPKSAGRTPIACSNCAKTKTKCDKKFPCTRCATRGLDCTLRPTRRASKNAQRILATAKAGTNPSSESASNNNSQDNSGRNSPLRDGPLSTQPQAKPVLPHDHQLPNAQTHPPHSPQPTSSAHSRTPSASQPASSAHSRNPSISQSVQQMHIQPRVDQPLHQMDVHPAESKPMHMPISTTTPPFFAQSPVNGLLPVMPTGASPSATPVNGFISQTPMSGYEDFVGSGQNHADEPSPRFLMDNWNMSMGQDFDNMRIDPSMMLSINLDMGMVPPTDSILGMIPEMSPTQTFLPIRPAIHTPVMDDSLSELHVGSSASEFYPSDRQHPVIDAEVADPGAIIAAEDAWPVFRCTPTIPSSSCPVTARLNLELLEQSLKNHEGWSNWRPSWNEADFQQSRRLSVARIQETTRDKLLAITQSFLHKALDIHKDGMSGSNSDSPGSTASNFILLPPAPVLELFLQSYANSFERFYPTTSRGSLDANELMQRDNDRASSLLVLMMIAQGGINNPSVQARLLTGGITEVCRISLFDLVEKNIIMAGDPIVLRAALLFTVQAAWSGDKWQMDIAMGQRGMYFTMLRHSGIMEPQQASPTQLNANDSDSLWRDWIQQESRSRLIYSWMMVDQDLSLFHDTAPLFSVTEFGAPMPDADRLWQARDPSEWTEIFSQVHEFSNGYPSVGSGARPLSLRDVFRHFLDDDIVAQNIQLTALHLRLLLHPLQTLVYQCRQLLSCFSNSMASRQHSSVLTAASTRVRLEEVQSLLQRWFRLAERYMETSAMCPLMQANLVVFHLISMNAVTNFPEIEKFARKEGLDTFQPISYQQLLWKHKCCISDVQEAVFHSGQIMRIIREMPQGVRPPWWPGAVYRAGLVLWLEALTHNELTSSSNHRGQFTPPTTLVAVDRLPSNHSNLVRYVQRREGIPTLTSRDGTPIYIDNGYGVLSYCLDAIGEGLATRFSDGLRRKLEKLARG